MNQQSSAWEAGDRTARYNSARAPTKGRDHRSHWPVITPVSEDDLANPETVRAQNTQENLLL
jgi:hypothetical protein